VAEVVLAVLTYRRNAELAGLLPELVRQLADAGRGGRVLVVDNDPDGGAQALVRGSNLGIDYVHERTPGIAAARNRAMDEADGDDLLVFIDDDERPSPDWLARLCACYDETKATAVVGAVESQFESRLDPWIEAGGFFRRQRFATGFEVLAAATNNLLLDMSELRRLGIRFDQAFGLSGGSDTLFSRQLIIAGARIVWCDAVVFDRVPAARATRGWVLRRALRSGNAWSRTSVYLQPSWTRRTRVRVDAGASGLVRVVAGLGQYVFGALTFSVSHRARGLRRTARGAGMLSGAFGYVYVEYRRAARDTADDG
jgi:glycosyltransferase involved in cell wall biosynthesis